MIGWQGFCTLLHSLLFSNALCLRESGCFPFMWTKQATGHLPGVTWDTTVIAKQQQKQQQQQQKTSLTTTRLNCMASYVHHHAG